VGIPVGDVLRTFVKGGWFRKVLDFLKGSSINVGGTQIDLSEKDGVVPPLRGSKFDSAPHKFQPPGWKGPRL
jgi:hypothetical protein